jgi:hypothetical protein
VDPEHAAPGGRHRRRSGGEASPHEVPQVQTATNPGLAWKVPARWTDKGAGTMRLATYTISGGQGEAQCAVYYFGPGQGGAVDANLDRWRGEFKDAQPDTPKKFDAPGAHVTAIEVMGTYMAHAGMAQGMGGEALESPHWALLGAIAEGPNGSVFFKLTGPEATVKAARKEFEAMLKSIHRA